MLYAELWEKLEAVARATRGSEVPFDGIQLVLLGDFYQLPPTAVTTSTRYDRRKRAIPVMQVSMLDAELWEKLEAVARATRGSEAPFEGIQLVLSGDFHQLPSTNLSSVMEFTGVSEQHVACRCPCWMQSCGRSWRQSREPHAAQRLLLGAFSWCCQATSTSCRLYLEGRLHLASGVLHGKHMHVWAEASGSGFTPLKQSAREEVLCA